MSKVNKVRKIFNKTIRQLYQNEIDEYDVKPIDVFRLNHKSKKAGINTYEEYKKHVKAKHKAEAAARKYYREVTLPQIKQQNIERFKAYLDYINPIKKTYNDGLNCKQRRALKKKTA